LISDWPVTAFSSGQYPFAAYLLDRFPVLLSTSTEVFALGFCPFENGYQDFSFHQCFVFSASFRRFLLQILAGFSTSTEALVAFPVCIDLINFRTTHLISEDLSIVFSHNASILLFLLPAGLSHPLLQFLCIATFPLLFLPKAGRGYHYWCEWSLPLSKLSESDF
jgi:hypothetical protein